MAVRLTGSRPSMRKRQIQPAQVRELPGSAQQAGEMAVVIPAAGKPCITEYVGARLADSHHVDHLGLLLGKRIDLRASVCACQLANSETQNGLPYLTRRSSCVPDFSPRKRCRQQHSFRLLTRFVIGEGNRHLDCRTDAGHTEDRNLAPEHQRPFSDTDQAE